MVPIQVARGNRPSPGGTRPSGYGSLATVGSTNPPQADGLGTRTNPYDLRSGLALYLTCQTECGYPQAVLEWSVNNVVSRCNMRLSGQRINLRKL